MKFHHGIDMVIRHNLILPVTRYYSRLGMVNLGLGARVATSTQ